MPDYQDIKLLKRLFYPLRTTPFHPQWLVLRQGGVSKTKLIEEMQGLVLDVGCGDRWIERELPADCQYVGLDYPATVNIGYEGKPTLFGDGQNLAFADGSFDVVIIMDVLEHMEHPGMAIQEAWRVLKPSGKLLVQVPFLYPLHDEPYDFQRWTEYGLKKLLQQTGFKIKTIKAYGSPIETAAGLLAISIAKAVLDAGKEKHLGLLLSPVLVLSIPIINSVGWLLAKLLPQSTMMPLSYRIFAVKVQ